MSFFSFGEFDFQLGYKVLDERVVRGSSGIMLLLGVIASINAFILQRYIVVPYISGFLAFNFLISVLINPRFSPTMLLAKLMVRKQSMLPIGAVQKRFAWTLGLLMSSAIFVMSLFLVNDATWFEPVCFWCLICIALLYFESVFGICVGCKIYYLGIWLKIIKAPEVKPNCMGDSCSVD